MEEDHPNYRGNTSINSNYPWPEPGDSTSLFPKTGGAPLIKSKSLSCYNVIIIIH